MFWSYFGMVWLVCGVWASVQTIRSDEYREVKEERQQQMKEEGHTDKDFKWVVRIAVSIILCICLLCGPIAAWLFLGEEE